MMKLSLVDLLNEISQKAGVTRDPLLLKLKLLSKQPNTYIHFTNQPNKLGINPSHRGGHTNPRGIYGHLLTGMFEHGEPGEFEGLFMSNRKYVVVFQPAPNLRIYHVIDSDRYREEMPGGAEKNTVYLMKHGYDGIATAVPYAMSGEIKNEIAIFKPSNVKILLMAPNTIRQEKTVEHYEQRLKNARIDNQNPANIKSAIQGAQNRGREFRKNNPI